MAISGSNRLRLSPCILFQTLVKQDAAHYIYKWTFYFLGENLTGGYQTNLCFANDTDEESVQLAVRSKKWNINNHELTAILQALGLGSLFTNPQLNWSQMAGPPSPSIRSQSLHWICPAHYASTTTHHLLRWLMGRLLIRSRLSPNWTRHWPRIPNIVTEARGWNRARWPIPRPCHILFPFVSFLFANYKLPRMS